MSTSEGDASVELETTPERASLTKNEEGWTADRPECHCCTLAQQSPRVLGSCSSPICGISWQGSEALSGLKGLPKGECLDCRQKNGR